MPECTRPFAEARGDRPALIDEAGETSWSALDERADRLVHWLRAQGLAHGDRLALVCGNRRENFEVVVAACQTGLLYVPLNWHWHPEEIAYVVENAGARAVIADERFAEATAEAMERLGDRAPAARLQIGGRPLPGFDAYEDALAGQSPEAPADLMAGGPMFYTSGTTGRPKGVRNGTLASTRPAALLGLMGKGLCAGLGIPAEGVTLLEGPLYHSAQWAFGFLPLAAGSTVVMRHKFDAAETLALIDRHAVTNVHLVPTQFVRLLRLDEATRRAFSGASLVQVLHGAAPCSPEIKRRMIQWWGPVVTEYYGATEGGIISTISADEWLRKGGSLGKPSPNIEVIVVGEDGQRLPPGEAGQLYFRNQSGADFEYHEDPEKTKAAHLEPGVFTFGDVGYLDDEGYLHMSDRKIDMVISGGVNIYPAEIEGVLVTHPAVADAAVFGVPNEEFGEEVKAAVELAPGHAPGEPLAEELIAHCREHLAGYKAPRSVDFEEALPRYPTGKLYKRILRDRYWEGVDRRI